MHVSGSVLPQGLGCSTRWLRIYNENTIRGGGSTALYTVTLLTLFTLTVVMVYNVDMVHTVDMVYTVDTGELGGPSWEGPG